jgi:hypothetical protein
VSARFVPPTLKPLCSRPDCPTDSDEFDDIDAALAAFISGNLMEHVFLGKLLRGLWRKNVRDLEVLRPEVDSGGYDLALEFRGLTRHMQLKSSFTQARRASV